MDALGQTELGVGWPDAVTGALRPGMTLDRYQLLAPVGMGGMACVWAARLCGYRGFSKLVAIKTVLPHLASHRDFDNMLLDEARIAADAHHPNVCNLFDVGEEGGVVYLVLEWVEGDSLIHVLRGSPAVAHPALDGRIGARIVADACAGLHAAHELKDEGGRSLGVVHRDVSPHNVLISIDGTTKISDFGVAKAHGQLHQTTRSGEIRGKLAYMAPEQISGNPVDRRADVFGMGCVLYAATTGQPPFCGDNDAHLMRAVLEGSYADPMRIVADYPADLAAIVRRALSSQPDDRFDTAEQMRTALEAWLAAGARATTATEVGEIVRRRIGAKLDRRRERVRLALESQRDSGATRPVRTPSPPTAVALLPPVHDDDTAVSSTPLPARLAGRPLKTTVAVSAGLLVAISVLLLRSQLVHRPDGTRDVGSANRPVASASTLPPLLTAGRIEPASPPAAPLASSLHLPTGASATPLPERPAPRPTSGRPIGSPGRAKPPELPTNPY